MSEKSTNTSNGIGFAGALFITFFVLKEMHVLSWSWFWVTAPLWGGLAIFVGIMLIIGVLLAGAWTWDRVDAVRRRRARTRATRPK